MQQGREPLDLDRDAGGAGVQGGVGWSRTGAVPLLVDSYPSSFPLHRMKRIPSGRRQKMGRRHEPPASGLGVVGGPSGPGGGGRERRVQPLFTWLPALGPAPEFLPSLPPAFSCLEEPDRLWPMGLQRVRHD